MWGVGVGVGTAEQRKKGFHRGKRVHVFAVAIMYFLLVVIDLIRQGGATQFIGVDIQWTQMFAAQPVY